MLLDCRCCVLPLWKLRRPFVRRMYVLGKVACQHM